MTHETLNDRVQRQFRLVCRKCGSDNVVIDIEHGYGGSEYTGPDPSTLSIGCNACHANDLHDVEL